MDEATAIDGHVHLYPRMDAARLFAAAARNLRRIAPAAQDRALLLTETARDDAFRALSRGRVRPEGWAVERLPQDPAALRLSHGTLGTLLLVAGRQVVTAERIEVLAIGTDASFDDGQSADETLRRIAAAGCPAILPWGLGKWIGRRGRLVEDLLDRHGPAVRPGDNAGRPVGWPRPGPFRGRAVLPGTDPLPIPGAEEEAGRYGLLLSGRLDAARPAADLVQRLSLPSLSVKAIGRRQNMARVAARQIALRRARAERSPS
ncbi:hypothetical protein MWU52_13025 [Jannaschia sp. S6380]|uniref:hypothetical protein n=1 Tax=Jannaschia sp. S6380 TaxID=2926408 RepID=UPI001FF3831A|nr:hypothetical protein [Jannaschia sp. S6380]MCK0168481.1 hypothetical protein [Jannaschia sp. S6380]